MKRFSVKYFVNGIANFEREDLIPIFHRWIQQHSLPGMLIDVADYRHVHQGPSILLIGHEADIVFDERAGRPGLAYVRKQGGSASLLDDLGAAFDLLEDACRKLEAEPVLNGLKFDYASGEITFLDRLNAPNNPDVFAELQPDLHALAVRLYGTESVQIESLEADPRKLLNVSLTRV
jgi:hypothetical protein